MTEPSLTEPPAAGRRDRLVDLAVSAVLAVVALAPLLVQRGVALRGDMVFVPHQPWKGAWLGLDGSVPRFVPGDALVSAATMLVPGDLLQKALLLGSLVLAGAGAGRLVRSYGALPRAAAVVLVCWNPWVLERLSIGQWGSVVGYAALPWLAVAAARLREDPRRGWPATVAWLGFAALWSPSAGLAGVLTAVCVVAVRPRPASLGVVVGGAVVANLPWLVPSLLVPGLVSPGGGEFGTFAARAESSAGLLPSLLSLGGIWKTSVVPAERTIALVVLLACVPTLAAIAALLTARRRNEDQERDTAAGLWLLAAVSFLVVLLPAVTPIGDALDRAATRIPAVGIVRDSDRYLGPVVLVLAFGLARAAQWLLDRARSRAPALRLVAVLLAAWPVLCLPSMAWGLGGDLRPVTYPGEWQQVAGLLRDDDTTVVLPWRGGYRGFAWNGHHAALDPAPRYFRGDVLIDDRLYVGDGQQRVLGNEDPRLAAVTTALAAPDPAASLRRIGVDHVLLEKGNGAGPAQLPSGRTVHDGALLTLVDLGSATGPAPGRRPPAAAVVGGDVLAGLALVVAAWWAIRRRTYMV